MENYLSTKDFNEQLQLEKEKKLGQYFKVYSLRIHSKIDHEIGKTASDVALSRRGCAKRIP